MAFVREIGRNGVLRHIAKKRGIELNQIEKKGISE